MPPRRGSLRAGAEHERRVLRAEAHAVAEREPGLGRAGDLDRAEPYESIYAMLFSHGVDSAGLAGVERWRQLIGRARRGGFLGVDERAFPRDFGVLARYQLPLARADYLRTQSGGAVRGVQGAFLSNALFAGAIGGSSGAGGGGGTGNAGGFSGGGGVSNLGSAGCCDPFAGFSVGFNQRSSPLNSEVLTGIPVATSHNASVNTFFGQGFLTGTSYVIAVDGTRQSSNVAVVDGRPSSISASFAVVPPMSKATRSRCPASSP